jgi:hypothetical protein
MAAAWEVERRKGDTGEWQPVLFGSKARALAHVSAWLREGYTIAGPYKRKLH